MRNIFLYFLQLIISANTQRNGEHNQFRSMMKSSFSLIHLNFNIIHRFIRDVELDQLRGQEETYQRFEDSFYGKTFTLNIYKMSEMLGHLQMTQII